MMAVMGFAAGCLVVACLGAYFTVAGEATPGTRSGNVGAVTLALAGEMLVVVAQIVAAALGGGRRETQPSPAERSLEAHFCVWHWAFILLF